MAASSGRRDVAGPDADEPARLELEEREVGALGEVLPDDAETRQVGVQRPVREGELGPEHPANLGVEVGNVEVVPRRADDRLEARAVPSANVTVRPSIAAIAGRHVMRRRATCAR